MRCLACNKRLSEHDATIRYANSGEFLDLCRWCRTDLPNSVQLAERADLATTETDDDGIDKTEDG